MLYVLTSRIEDKRFFMGFIITMFWEFIELATFSCAFMLYFVFLSSVFIMWGSGSMIIYNKIIKDTTLLCLGEYDRCPNVSFCFCWLISLKKGYLQGKKKKKNENIIIYFNRTKPVAFLEKGTTPVPHFTNTFRVKDKNFLNKSFKTENWTMVLKPHLYFYTHC